MDAMRSEKLSTIDILQQNSVASALEGLYHDEHIHAAWRLGILDQAFILQHSFDQIDPALSERGMQVLPTEINLKESTEQEQKTYFDSILESSCLQRQLQTWHDQTPAFNFKTMNYILDIDLDVFKSFDSIQPKCPQVFHDLIRHAVGITIARESQWIQRLKYEPQLDSCQLEQHLIRHLHKALS